MGGLHLLAPGHLELGSAHGVAGGPPLRLELEPAATRRHRRRGGPRGPGRGGEAPVYGVNTGFGKLARVRIRAGRHRGAAASPGPFPHVRRGHAVGRRDGSPGPGVEGGSLALGRSGVRQATVDALLRLLAATPCR